MITDIIIVVILVLIVGAAGLYVYKAKKSGKKCIGCPDSGSCGCGCRNENGASPSQCGSCSGCSGCGK